MEQITLPTNKRVLQEEPDYITSMFVEPGDGRVYARHLFATLPIFVGIIPKEFIGLFAKKIIQIKSWKVIEDEVQLKIELT